ncbi:ABC transporter family substrate-binding protein [Streptomyces sp. H27-C3]|uniref:ABC transporter family substrate-binding protein n=1 Tax=Streptomyces sp. H27-C3 TaxID=3046305 RepID=UPI0024BBA2C8|nr:ABC transporter family substrate-binding protein [Streptomyces sp. H27-C3]MDJ0465391.1 ABC transporter family substrate-binding protein [Streptomyces sp. H27-C3]
MSHVGVPRGKASRCTPQRSRRSLALLTTGVLALPVLAGCSAGDEEAQAVTAAQDVAPAGRELVADGGSVRWAVDTMPATLNAFQADADATTTRIAGAVLPSLFTLDERGRPQRNADYLESAEVVEREPKQVVLYKLNQQAVWSDGREIGAPDFVAQWRALSGKDTAYWTARNAGYERIERIERGANDLEVKVTYRKPYADWRALFTPLYPKDVMGSPDSFNDGARGKLKVTAGPFALKELDRAEDKATLVRNPRWWGQPAKLDTLVLRAVPSEKRTAALAGGKLDIAEIGRSAVDRVTLAARDAGAAKGQQLNHGPGATVTPASALRSWALANGSSDEKAEAEQEIREKNSRAVKKYADEQAALRGFAIRKSLEPAYTQLALNGTSGPLTDDRVRRAVARALDRQELAEAVLKPLGLPAEPLGSHLALAGQQAYADSSGALGKQDTRAAQALLADAGWTPSGANETPDGTEAGSKPNSKKDDGGKKGDKAEQEDASDDGGYIVGDEESGDSDSKPGDGGYGSESGRYVLAPARIAALQGEALFQQASSLDTEKSDTRKSDGEDSEGEDSGSKKSDGKKSDRKSDSDSGSDSDPGSGSGVSTHANAKAKSNEKGKGGVAGAYAPRGTAAPAVVGGPLGKDGKVLTLRFVLPSGPGSEPLRTVGDKISRMLEEIGVRTEMIKVSDASYFKDHIAAGDYDLALYSWPATAYPATDARPIFAKPEPAADGSLQVEQNYTRVGTDHIDQLFDQAAGELDDEEARDLMRRTDARIWAAAGSIPLFQRPELVAIKPNLANAGAFGLAAPRYQDIGFKKPQTAETKKK